MMLDYETEKNICFTCCDKKTIKEETKEENRGKHFSSEKYDGHNDINIKYYYCNLYIENNQF